jgi:hypothetical protein
VHPEGIPPAYQITVDGDPDRFAVLPKQANVYRAHQQVQRENERLQ